MALHIAAGRDWHGKRVEQGAVLYIALERKKLVERRAIAFRETYDLSNLPFAIMGGVHDFRDPRTATRIVEIAKQVEEATETPLRLICIDTLSRALCGGDENASKDADCPRRNSINWDDRCRAQVPQDDEGITEGALRQQ